MELTPDLPPSMGATFRRTPVPITADVRTPHRQATADGARSTPSIPSDPGTSRATPRRPIDTGGTPAPRGIVALRQPDRSTGRHDPRGTVGATSSESEDIMGRRRRGRFR
ncbi:hypothetical protein GCM10011610_10070 [Nocardia rhizosphaerihabitans]|uniref:Uncharacterized protein n=1 Tax=Nocardia rhizosphaerihabitans TaxID=1691570 RepID=A0ABQ2K798_9NOCA|nr:hypothetical protein GCM10011610_10070 [Nocardia rhizosphaerihabitans]